MIPDNFAKYPASISEITGETTAEWSPRDALINTLRDLDSGKINPSSLIIGWTEPTETATPDWRYAMSVKNRFEMIGALMNIIKHFTDD